MVLIIPADATAVPQSFSDLTDARFKRIAIGAPASVPAGMYARQVFDNLKITAALSGKLVFGQNVRQVLDYVIRGEVDAGVVYVTDAIQAGSKVRVAATADASLHQPIIYPAAVITKAPHAVAARAFLDYLWGQPARQEFQARGFTAISPTSAPATVP